MQNYIAYCLMCCKGAKTSYLAALFVIKIIERRCCYGKKRQIN
nr:MAG TPA_asm: hypothetical protein [Caudoviricetes sp.]